MTTTAPPTNEQRVAAANQRLRGAYQRLASHADGRDVAQQRAALRKAGAALRALVVNGRGDLDTLLAAADQAATAADELYTAELAVLDEPDDPEPEPRHWGSVLIDPAPQPEPAPEPAPEPEPEPTLSDISTRLDELLGSSRMLRVDLLEEIHRSSLPLAHREVLESFTAAELHAALTAALALVDADNAPSSATNPSLVNAVRSWLREWYADRSVPRPSERNNPSTPNQ